MELEAQEAAPDAGSAAAGGAEFTEDSVGQEQQQQHGDCEAVGAANAEYVHAAVEANAGRQQAAGYEITESEAHQAMAFPVQQYTGSSPDHGTGTCSQKKGLTFSGPPYVPKARPYARADFSHSNNRLMKIAYDNQKLVQRLTNISRKEPSWSQELTKTSPSNVASSAVNRRKAATAIAQENHALYQRLVGIKPSKDISRETLDAEHRQNESYRTNCATFKVTSPKASHDAAE